MSISGNYNTTEREIDIVKKILNSNNIYYEKVEKYHNADDADIIVTLSEGKTFLIEVKEENYETRFKKYGELGIDFISAFQFKKDISANKWKGHPKQPSQLNAFLKDIAQDPSLKKGKIYYSNSSLWLFFVDKGVELDYWFYDGTKMVSQEFKDYLFENCIFAVNNKPTWQQSHSDTHNSACFYIKPNDDGIKKYLVDINKYVKKV